MNAPRDWTRTRRACIDCGQPCHHSCYRCRSCADNERRNFATLVHWCRPNPSTTGIAEHAALVRAARVELVEDYLSIGIEPYRIAADFGITCESLARSMQRAGRNDLAAKTRKPWRAAA